MKKPKTKASRFSKKQIVLLLIVSIAAVLVGLWGWNQVAPRPLGDKLEYIGKNDLGGWFIKPYSVYYYGTDMTMEEMKTYFRNAEYDQSIEDSIGHSATYNSRGLHFTSANGDFIITYYSDSTAVIESIGLHKTNKQFVVSVLDSKYQAANGSLRP